MNHRAPAKPQPPLFSGIEGLIFDMDDLLVHSKRIWHEAIGKLIFELGYDQTVLNNLSYRGLSATDTAALIHKTLGVTITLPCFQRRFVECLLSEVNRRPVVPLPGALQAIRQASAIGPVAVASGSPLEVIHSILGQLGVIDDIKVVLSSDEVAAGKPEPDVFLEAAQLLKVDPAACVVFEDSLVGVKAAISAGMRCIAVPSEAEQSIRNLTPHVYASLADLPWPESMQAVVQMASHDISLKR